MKNTRWAFSRKQEDGTTITEEVPLERWVWGVIYVDNSEFKQFDDNGVFHQIGEVDQDRVKVFILHKPDMSRRIDIVIPEGARLIFKYRNYVFNAAMPNETRQKVYIFGYKDGSRYHVNFVMPDDGIIQAADQDLPLSGYFKY